MLDMEKVEMFTFLPLLNSFIYSQHYTMLGTEDIETYKQCPALKECMISGGGR